MHVCSEQQAFSFLLHKCSKLQCLNRHFKLVLSVGGPLLPLSLPPSTLVNIDSGKATRLASGNVLPIKELDKRPLYSSDINIVYI